MRRTRPLVYPAAAALLAIAVLVGLAHRPTQTQRAADLRGFLADMNADIESCAGGVGESLGALRAINTGTSSDVATAINIARTGASNCSPANSDAIGNLAQYQVTESLASFRLDGVVAGLLRWAWPDAQQVQTDVANVLTARGGAAKASAQAALERDLRTLDAQRSAVDSVIESAIRSLSARAAPPSLPG